MSTETEKILLDQMKTLTDKMDRYYEGRYTNGVEMARHDERLSSIEKSVKALCDRFEDQAKFRRSVNMKLWMFLAGLVATVLQSRLL
jgi:hypothetical protein